MAKALKPDPITENDIIDYLSKSSDFTFEINTLNSLTCLGYACKHSGTYTDPNTQKTREYDIRAEANKRISNFITFRLLLAIECKNLKENFPLVVHCMPRTSYEAKEDLLFCYFNDLQKVFNDLGFSDHEESRFKSATIQLPRDLTNYKINEPVGKSCDQIGRSVNNDLTGCDSDVFDKISQALNSSFDLVKEASSSTVHTACCLSMIKPVLVVPDNSLWQIIYDRDGNIIKGPEHADYIPYYYGKNWPYCDAKTTREYAISHLDIVTYSFLQTHIRSMLAFENIDLLEFVQRKQQEGLISKEIKLN